MSVMLATSNPAAVAEETAHPFLVVGRPELAALLALDGAYQADQALGDDRIAEIELGMEL